MDERDGRRAWKILAGSAALVASFSLGRALAPQASVVDRVSYIPCTHNLPVPLPEVEVLDWNGVVNRLDHVREQGINARENPEVPNPR